MLEARTKKQGLTISRPAGLERWDLNSTLHRILHSGSARRSTNNGFAGSPTGGLIILFDLAPEIFIVSSSLVSALEQGPSDRSTSL